MLVGMLIACASSKPDTAANPLDTDALDPDTDTEGQADPDPWPHVARIARPDSMAGFTLGTGREVLDLGTAFYADHDGDFDFLVAYTSEEIAGIFAFALPLRHDIEGIGQQEVMALYGWDDLDPGDAGSAGRLQQIMLMNAPSLYRPGAFYSAQDILIHETGHRWSANLRLDSADPWILTDEFWSHWSIYANVGGPSAEGYGTLEDLGDGTFRYDLVVPLRYADLELYQQGLLAAEEVGSMFTVEGATDFDPPDNNGLPWDDGSYGAAVSFAGSRVDVTMDDVLAVHGPRVPAHDNAQTDFRVAFALVCDGQCDEAALAWVDAERAAFPASFEAATRGLATAATEL